MRRFVVLVSVVLTLAGCSGEEGEPLDETNMDERGVRVLNFLADGEFDDVRDRFDATMKDSLSEDGLRDGWAGFQAQFGEFEDSGTPRVLKRGELSVVSIPLEMSEKAGELRVTFHPDGRIAGLFFLKEGVEVPE